MPDHKQLIVHYADYYADGAAEWRRLSAVAQADNIVRLCAGITHSTVIEIGAGDGAILKQLAERNFADRFTALEVSPSGLAEIRRQGIAGLESSIFDGAKVPFPLDSFDVAVMSHVVEHLDNPRALIREAARVSKHLFIEVPMEDNAGLRNDFVMDHTGHINFYNPKTIRQLLQSCDLEVVAQMVVNPPMAASVFAEGLRGWFKSTVKVGALAATPSVATSLFTYNGALLCRKHQ